MSETNCKNCGAPLKGGRCEYCGTEKPEPQYFGSFLKITADCIQFGAIAGEIEKQQRRNIRVYQNN